MHMSSITDLSRTCTNLHELVRCTNLHELARTCTNLPRCFNLQIARITRLYPCLFSGLYLPSIVSSMTKHLNLFSIRKIKQVVNVMFCLDCMCEHFVSSSRRPCLQWWLSGCDLWHLTQASFQALGLASSRSIVPMSHENGPCMFCLIFTTLARIFKIPVACSRLLLHFPDYWYIFH